MSHLEAIAGHLGAVLVHLGRPLGHLGPSGASWAHLGAILARLVAVLGRLVAILGRLVAVFASQKPPNGGPKNLIFLVFSILSRSAAFLKPPWLNMASFTVLVPSWAHLGAILGRLGRVLGRIVAVLGRLVAALASQKPPNGGPKNLIFPLFFQCFRVPKPS